VSFVKDVIDGIIKDRRNPIFHGHGAPNTSNFVYVEFPGRPIYLLLTFSCFFFQLTKRVARKDARRVECLVRLISREIVGPVGVTESVRSIRFPRFSRPDRYDSGPKPLRILER